MYGYLQGFIVGALSLLGFAARGVPRHAPRAAAAARRRALAVRAAVRSGRRAAGRRHAGQRLRGARPARPLGPAAARACARSTGCSGPRSPRASGWASPGSSARWRSSPPARSPLRRDIQRSASSAISTSCCRRRAGSSTRWPGSIRCRRCAGPRPTSRRRPAASSPAAGVRAARGSVVRVLGSACGLGIEGSGWVAAPGIVVTNAHVVAGETDTTVQVDGQPPALPAAGARLRSPRRHRDPARARACAPRPALAAAAQPGTEAAILGFPLDGPFDAEPARVGDTQTVSTEDAYGNGPVQRGDPSLRGRVRPGQLGRPAGRARRAGAGTVFAAVTGAADAAAASPCRTAGGAAAAAGAGAWRASAPGHCAGDAADVRVDSGAAADLDGPRAEVALGTPGRAVVCTPPARRR